MRTINVVKALRNQGHSVSYVTRVDGGVRIYSVDGIKFSKSNSDGNNFARELADLNLTAKQYSQRRESGGVALKLSKARKTQNLPSLSVRKADKSKTRKQKVDLRKAVRKLNKLRKEHGQKAFDPVKLRQRIRRHGYGETLKSVKNIMLKNAGIAYPRATESFREYLDELNGRYNHVRLSELIDRVKDALDSANNLIMDSTLKHLYEEFYDIEKQLRDGDGKSVKGVFIGTGARMEKEIEKSFAEAMGLVDF